MVHHDMQGVFQGAPAGGELHIMPNITNQLWQRCGYVQD